jgi:tRNA G37 N-methylase Trm5
MNHPAENTNAHLPPERKKRLTYDRIGTIAIISSCPKTMRIKRDEILRHHVSRDSGYKRVLSRYRVARFRVKGTDT